MPICTCHRTLQHPYVHQQSLEVQGTDHPIPIRAKALLAGWLARKWANKMLSTTQAALAVDMWSEMGNQVRNGKTSTSAPARHSSAAHGHQQRSIYLPGLNQILSPHLGQNTSKPPPPPRPTTAPKYTAHPDLNLHKPPRAHPMTSASERQTRYAYSESSSAHSRASPSQSGSNSFPCIAGTRPGASFGRDIVAPASVIEVCHQTEKTKHAHQMITNPP